jgi:hypothetical protein
MFYILTIAINKQISGLWVNKDIYLVTFNTWGQNWKARSFGDIQINKSILKL